MNCIHDTYLYMPCYGYQWLFQYLGMCTYLAGRSHPDIICLRAYGNSYVSFIYSTEIFVTMFVCLFETYLLWNGWTDLHNSFFVSSVWAGEGFRQNKFRFGIKIFQKTGKT